MHLSVYRDALRAAGLRPAIKAWWKDRQVRLAFFKSEYVDKIGEMYTQNPFILAYIATPVVYFSAFVMELWWLVEADILLPAPAYLLASIYFITFLVSLFLLSGLFLRKSTYLLAWLFVLVIFFFPECGLSLFMSLKYWNLNSRGVAELSFYCTRLAINALCIICIQSLYTQWRQEKSVMKRLEDMNIMPSSISPVMVAKEPLTHNGMITQSHRGWSVSSAPRITPLRTMFADSEPTFLGSPVGLSRSASMVRRSHSSVSSSIHSAIGVSPFQPQPSPISTKQKNGDPDFFCNPDIHFQSLPRSEFDVKLFRQVRKPLARTFSELQPSNSHHRWKPNHHISENATSSEDLHHLPIGFDYTRSLDRAELRVKRHQSEPFKERLPRHSDHFINSDSRVKPGACKHPQRHGGPPDRRNVPLSTLQLQGITLGRVHSARPFDYLTRPGGMSYLPRPEQATSGSNQSVRDIAL
ncbi:uncharacterized protein LOC111263774 isoform X2 [Varroa jacobsoni]|uniref:Uncharacterized protein n=1 Tax=Varroa destructor TaxID=109461 RepID=A0A7M7M2X2_VARDE|nr:uncharacterized protein LOC111242825 isoform X2 [Varroa destructor]XP_022694903.1 uncharacterized protein LOC111263774 isoform X2 [Varroa jacobsoni]